MLRVYVYKGCATCRNALKWLKARNLPFTEVPIRETPPTAPELQAMLDARQGDLRALFNTASADYRELGIKDKLPGMKPSAAFQLLQGNGNLVKRPFAIDQAAKVWLTGFKEPEWEAAFPKT